MEKRMFGATGLEVSVLGFGGAPIGHLETNLIAAGKGPLPDDVVKKIQLAFARPELDSGEIWLGQI